jgi:hypothetical protein
MVATVNECEVGRTFVVVVLFVEVWGAECWVLRGEMLYADNQTTTDSCGPLQTCADNCGRMQMMENKNVCHKKDISRYILL